MITFLFFRSSYLIRSEEAGSVDPDLVKHLPDQPGSVFVSFRYVRIVDFQSIISSLISGNEVLNFVSKMSDVIGIRLD